MQELSYLFLPEFWRHGYAYESCCAVLDYCSSELHMDAIVAETQSKNTSSRALLEKLGFSLIRQLERFGAKQCVYEKRI